MQKSSSASLQTVSNKMFLVMVKFTASKHYFGILIQAENPVSVYLVQKIFSFSSELL